MKTIQERLVEALVASGHPIASNARATIPAASA
jgi:hypothetical protein